jgi:hypothetical protein
VLISIIVYLFVSKRSKFLPVFIAIAFMGSLFLSTSIIERASKGLDSLDANEILAGRVDNIWLPLIEEYMQDPSKLMFGNGRYGILTSDVAARGYISDVSKAHNMYLEQILDTGIIGFVMVISLFIVFFKKVLRSLTYIHNNVAREYQYAIIASLISFGAAGISGRSLFPQLSNGYFWIILGLSFAIMRMEESSGEENVEEA